MNTSPFDVQDYLKTPEERAAYLDALLEERSRYMTQAGIAPVSDNPIVSLPAVAT